jgi:putative ABC transport system permease protein
MAWMRFFRRGRRDEEAAREIASYIAIETDDNIARGMPPPAAHDAALRKFGNATRVREEIYWINSIRPLDTLWQDTRFGARLLWRDKGFAIAAILSLALGIGANTAIFQLLDTVRLRALPVEQPESLVNIAFARGSVRSGRFSSRWPAFTYAQYQQLRTQQKVFATVFAWTSGAMNTASGGEARNVETLEGSGELFTALHVSPVLGRVLLPEDDRAGCPAPVAVISHAYWQRAFGGSDAVLQQTVRLRGVEFPIVGVTEPSFFGLEVGRRFDVAIPLCADVLVQNGVNRFEGPREWWLAIMGRLAPGHTRQQADDHLVAISPAFMAATVPAGYTVDDERKYREAKLTALPAGTGVSDLRDEFGEPLVVLLAGTGLVLLIACANLANLLLARATAREREIAVRLSIGASRSRIVRQLIVESLLLAVIGTLLGVFVARGLSTVLVSQLGGSDALFLVMDWNLKVFGFTTAVSLIACLLFGVAPAIKATSLAPAAALKTGGRGVTTSRERFGLRRGLVVAQVALSLVLLIGALMFTRTLYNLLTVDPGFNQDVLHVGLTHRSLTTDDPARGQAQRVELRDRLAAIPGVAGVAITDNMMLAGSFWNEFIHVDGIEQKGLANFTRVSGNFFALLDIPIVRGRAFNDGDVRQAPRVAIVNETFVRKILNGADPLGKLLWVELAPGEPIEKMEIVGVARDTKYGSIREDFEPLVHVASTQSGDFRAIARFVIKPRTTAATLTPAIVRAVAEINPAIDVNVRVIRQAVSNGLVRERLMAALSGAFGALAGLLAAIGLYGVLSYTVTRRSNEIGIRLAMGASRAAVLRMVIVEAGWLVGVGVVIGTALGLGAANAARSMLFGLRPTDPVTIVIAIAMLASIGLIASYLPARRASRVDPMNVLRQE